MKLLLFILLTALASLQSVQSTSVAIVGAGAGGSSAAFYLSRAAKQNEDVIDIDVFESRMQAGGRSRTVTPYNDSSYDPVELGASIFVGANKNMVKAVREFDYNLADSSTGSFGIYDGESFVFESSDWTYWNYVKLLWRYGYAAPRRVQLRVKEAVGKFLQLYNARFLHDNGPWKHAADMIADLGLSEEVGHSALSYLDNTRFANEVVEAATRVNYGQDIDSIHALGALVSMAGSNGMSVDGGNWRVFQRFLEESDAYVHFGNEVVDVRRTEEDKWRVYVDGIGATARLYDYVILAAPVPLFQVPYVDLHVTLVATNASSYAADAIHGIGRNPPSMLLTTDFRHREGGPGKQPLSFNSINYVQKAKSDSEDEWIVKIFSEEPDAWRDEDVNALFGGAQNVGWTHRHTFKAYPYLTPHSASNTTQLPPFEIDDGLFYVNAMEPMISTMETETLSARNIVGLVAEKLNYSKGWKDACVTENGSARDWVWIDCQ